MRRKEDAMAGSGRAGRREWRPQTKLVRVARGSSTQTVLASEGLVAPAGLLVGDDAIYVSNFGVFPGQGQIVRIDR